MQIGVRVLVVSGLFLFGLLSLEFLLGQKMEKAFPNKSHLKAGLIWAFCVTVVIIFVAGLFLEMFDQTVSEYWHIASAWERVRLCGVAEFALGLFFIAISELLGAETVGLHGWGRSLAGALGSIGIVVAFATTVMTYGQGRIVTPDDLGRVWWMVQLFSWILLGGGFGVVLLCIALGLKAAQTHDEWTGINSIGFLVSGAMIVDGLLLTLLCMAAWKFQHGGGWF
jgi:hypothetical protein